MYFVSAHKKSAEQTKQNQKTKSSSDQKKKSLVSNTHVPSLRPHTSDPSLQQFRRFGSNLKQRVYIERPAMMWVEQKSERERESRMVCNGVRSGVPCIVLCPRKKMRRERKKRTREDGDGCVGGVW